MWGCPYHWLQAWSSTSNLSLFSSHSPFYLKETLVSLRRQHNQFFLPWFFLLIAYTNALSTLVLRYCTLYLNDLADSVTSTCVPSARGRRLIMLLLEQDTKTTPVTQSISQLLIRVEGKQYEDLKNEIFAHKLKCLNCVPDPFQLQCAAWCADVYICLSWPAFTGWRGDFGWTHTDVRCGGWMGIVPRGEALVGALHEPFPVSVWMVSAFVLADHSPFQPDCFQPSLVLLAEQHCSSIVPCWEFYLMAFWNKLRNCWNTTRILPDFFFRLPTGSLPETTESAVTLWFEGWALLCLMQWLSCFCISQSTSLSIGPGVHAAVSAWTAAGSWMCPLCAGQQGLTANSRAGQNFMTFKEDFLGVSVCLHLHVSEIFVGSRCPSNNTL